MYNNPYFIHKRTSLFYIATTFHFYDFVFTELLQRPSSDHTLSYFFYFSFIAGGEEEAQINLHIPHDYTVDVFTIFFFQLDVSKI